MSKKVLVCGGAGYVGSHTVAALLERGYGVIVADNLETGHRDAVWDGAELIVGDLRDLSFVERLFSENKGIDAVIDFAAYSLVAESVVNPLKYYGNNLAGTVNLLTGMLKGGTNAIVFSSTAAVYGVPESVPVRECAPTSPINPYGETKLAIEKMLNWVSAANGINYAALRYFNVAGAHISGTIGEDHRPETHLIPNIIAKALRGETVHIFGDDYDTKDGFCVRDYVQASDLADAHILALESIMSRRTNVTYNLGNGNGFSNMDIVAAARKVSGLDIKFEVGPRRPGDPGALVASAERIVSELGWNPGFVSPEDIIETALRWHKSHPNGYGD